MNVIITLVEHLNHKSHDKELALQCEENGNKIAFLQGFLAGAEEYKSCLRNAGYDLDLNFDGTECRSALWRETEDGDIYDMITGVKLKLLMDSINEVKNEAEFQRVGSEWQSLVDKKKDYLFFCCEKVRDLHYMKGWYSAMNTVNETVKLLQKKLEQEEYKKAESLPFGD